MNFLTNDFYSLRLTDNNIEKTILETVIDYFVALNRNGEVEFKKGW